MKLTRNMGLEEKAFELPIEDDHTLGLISLAVSAKRIADALEHMREDTEQIRAGVGFTNRNWFECGTNNPAMHEVLRRIAKALEGGD